MGCWGSGTLLEGASRTQRLLGPSPSTWRSPQLTLTEEWPCSWVTMRTQVPGAGCEGAFCALVASWGQEQLWGQTLNPEARP